MFYQGVAGNVSHDPVSHNGRVGKQDVIAAFCAGAIRHTKLEMFAKASDLLVRVGFWLEGAIAT